MAEKVLQVARLKKYFPLKRNFLASFTRKPKRFVHAVDDVSFDLDLGEILALVGESGSGKTTTGFCTLGLIEDYQGQILLQGEEVDLLVKGRGVKALRRKAQMIFQDPYESLNPRQTVFQTVVEPLNVHQIGKDQQEKYDLVEKALEEAGLKPASAFLKRYPQELSGGQRQRVVIASSLVLNPIYLVADEPVSMLDVSIRAEILNLLLRLRQEHQISMLYITHDLASAAYIADRVAVMYLGRIVEIGPASIVLSDPQHPYTQSLMSVIPVPAARKRKRKRIVLKGETPNPIDLPGGCRFHPRCPLAEERCKITEPLLLDLGKDHRVACLLVNGH